MAQSRFGAGFLWGVPVGVANPTPVMFSALQDCSVDWSQDNKMLYGSGKYPIEQAAGKAKLEVKATVGRIDPLLFNTIFFGGLSASTVTLGSAGEAAVIPATPFTITVAQGAQFRVDLGVYDVALGVYMTRVASAPATGQYTVNTTTGAYLFAVADVGKSLLIYYTYGASSGGFTITSGNPILGSAVYFRATLQQAYNGKQSVLTINKNMASKLSMPLKLDDFTLPAFTFSAQDDDTGNVFSYSSQT